MHLQTGSYTDVIAVKGEARDSERSENFLDCVLEFTEKI